VRASLGQECGGASIASVYLIHAVSTLESEKEGDWKQTGAFGSNPRPVIATVFEAVTKVWPKIAVPSLAYFVGEGE